MEGEVHNISSFSGAPQILSSYQDKNKKFWLSRYDLFAQKPNCDQPSTGLWKKAINGRLTHLKGGQSFNGKGQKNNWLFYKEANNAKPVFALNDEEGEELILVRDNEGEELKNEALSLGAITALKFVNYKNGLRLYKSSTNFSDKINEILWIGFSSGKVLPLDIQADKGQRLLADFGFYSFFRSGRGDILEFYDFPHDESLYFIDRAGKTVRKFKIVNSILDLNQAYISME